MLPRTVCDLFDSTRYAAMECNAMQGRPHDDDDGNSREQGARTPGDTNVGPRVGREQ